MNILGILVVYDCERQIKARQVFQSLLENCSGNYTLCVVSNNPALPTADVIGSNSAAEFSGWDEGVSQQNIDDYDAIVLANDTFCTRRKFDKSDIENFTRLLIAEANNHAHYIVGEVHWSINYARMIKARKFLLRWVRTSVFAIAPRTFHAIQGVGIDPGTLDQLIQIQPGAGLKYADSVAPLAKERIQAWLFPVDGREGWHTARQADLKLLHLKAKSVLQEICLSVRCEEAGASFAPINNQEIFKNTVFKILYFFQRALPKQ